MESDKQEILFKASYAPQLLTIAKGDLSSAMALRKTGEGRPENVCYLAQQAIVKAIRSVLVTKQIPFPLIQNAAVLVAKMPSRISPPHGYDLGVLTQYATIRRYEEAETDLTEQDLEASIRAAQDVIKWADSIIVKGKSK